MNSAPEYDTSIRGKNCVIFVASVEMLLVTIFFIVTIASYVNNEEKNPDTNLTLVTPLVCLIVFGLIPVGGLFFGGVSETVILCRIWYWINFFCYIGWFGYKCYNIYEGNKPTPKLTLVLEITWSTYRVVSLYIVSAYMQSIKDMKSYLSQ